MGRHPTGKAWGGTPLGKHGAGTPLGKHGAAPHWESMGRHPAGKAWGPPHWESMGRHPAGKAWGGTLWGGTHPTGKAWGGTLLGKHGAAPLLGKHGAAPQPFVLSLSKYKRLTQGAFGREESQNHSSLPVVPAFPTASDAASPLPAYRATGVRLQRRQAPAVPAHRAARRPSRAFHTHRAHLGAGKSGLPYPLR